MIDKDVPYQFPKWSDGEGRIVFVGDGKGNTDIVLLHPEHPPHILNKETEIFEIMQDD